MSVIVFPGQGSQFLEMSKDFYDNFDTARDVFNLVSDTTNIDVKNIIFKNPSNLLNQTQYTQLAIFCASISIFKVIEKEVDLGKLNINYIIGFIIILSLTIGFLTIQTFAGRDLLI